MANKHNGEVALDVDGKTFTMRLTTNKATVAESHMGGASIFDFEGGLTSIRAILFAMTEGQHGIKSIADAGDLIDEDPLEVTKRVNEATALFFQKYTS